MEQKVLSITQINEYIRGRLDADPLLGNVAVCGEISNYKLYPSGHHYFTLKDEGGALKCVMFKGSALRLRFRPENGMKVIAMGKISVYPRDGAYQLYVASMVVDGVGDLHAAFEQLKAKLAAQGLFDPAHKKPIPKFPGRIGIVTSSAGAAVHDMLRILRKRYPLSQVYLLPVRVQGAEAPAEIVGAIRYANYYKLADLLIVGRGGGSIEDLWAFNEECVVRAVAASKIPVISAVGHETDFTLCDFAADVRAGTPSIAAEIAVPVKAELLQQVKDLAERLKRAPERAGEVFAQRIDHLAVRLSASLGNAASAAEARLLRSEQRLLPVLKDAVVESERRRSRLDQRLLPALKDSFSKNERRIVAASAKLDLLDPGNPLKRGYSLTLNSEGSIVRSVEAVKSGDVLKTRIADGEISSTVS